MDSHRRKAPIRHLHEAGQAFREAQSGPSAPPCLQVSSPFCRGRVPPPEERRRERAVLILFPLI